MTDEKSRNSEAIYDGRIVAERVGESCHDCQMVVTVEEVIRREMDNWGRFPDAKRIKRKLSSLGEGHAYFVRPHKVTGTMSVGELEEYIERAKEHDR